MSRWSGPSPCRRDSAPHGDIGVTGTRPSSSPFRGNMRKEVGMKVFVAGASGALGGRLVPLLAEQGHEVVAMTRSPDKTDLLRRLGAEPVVADGLDKAAVTDA